MWYTSLTSSKPFYEMNVAVYWHQTRNPLSRKRLVNEPSDKSMKSFSYQLRLKRRPSDPIPHWLSSPLAT